MKKYFWWIICGFLICSISVISWRPANAVKSNIKNSTKTTFTTKELFGQYISDIYNTAQLQQTGMDMAVLQKAITGYINLKLAHKLSSNSSVITVVDFNKPSREKRMWIVDLISKKLLLNTWVSHGRGSGDDMATSFSNINHSHQSSLGFYVTDDIYIGKHGRSLRLDGVDAGYNSSARARAIVVHAAEYVCENTIKQMGRLGRSQGCPAVSPEVSDMVINTIKGKNMLFITGKTNNYSSKYLDETLAEHFLYPDSASVTMAKL
ncbi:hypothetical protein GCM10023149_14750 [Mucilaginibacter gynuensis]|uniref:L,D-transpeptidase-like protein n=1 Tax=Mucilaginibacter gynuensis TaxID=1302236 RepID=A0ABP8G4D9_9SPHI